MISEDIKTEEVKKLTPLELDKLKQLQSVDAEIQGELSSIGRLEFEIDTRKKAVFLKLANSNSEQSTYFKDIETKYGKVKLNIETGDIIEE